MTQHNLQNKYDSDEEIAEMLSQKTAHIKPSEASLHALLKALPDSVPTVSPYASMRRSFFSFQNIMAPAFAMVLIISCGTIYFFSPSRESAAHKNTLTPITSVAVTQHADNVNTYQKTVASDAVIEKQVALIDTQMPSRFNTFAAATAPNSAVAPSQTQPSSAIPNTNVSAPDVTEKIFTVAHLMTTTGDELQARIASAKAGGKDVKSLEYTLTKMTSHVDTAISLALTSGRGVDSTANTNKAIDELVLARQNLEQLIRELKSTQ